MLYRCTSCGRVLTLLKQGYLLCCPNQMLEIMTMEDTEDEGGIDVQDLLF